MIDMSKSKEKVSREDYLDGNSSGQKDGKAFCYVDRHDDSDLSRTSLGLRSSLWTWTGIMEGWQDFKKKANL